jgi:hypothetical protein
MLRPVIAVITRPSSLEFRGKKIGPVKNDRVPPNLLACGVLKVNKIDRLANLLMYRQSMLVTIPEGWFIFAGLGGTRSHRRVR